MACGINGMSLHGQVWCVYINVREVTCAEQCVCSLMFHYMWYVAVFMYLVGLLFVVYAVLGSVRHVQCVCDICVMCGSYV